MVRAKGERRTRRGGCAPPWSGRRQTVTGTDERTGCFCCGIAGRATEAFATAGAPAGVLEATGATGADLTIAGEAGFAGVTLAGLTTAGLTTAGLTVAGLAIAGFGAGFCWQRASP